MAQTKPKAAQFFGVIGHGTDGYFLRTNADGTMSWAEVSSGPSVTSVTYPGDDTAADPAGGQSVILTGTSFATSGMSVTIGGTTAPSVSHDSNTQLTITTPAKAAGDYDIVVTNGTTGASGTFVNGISYNGVPTWTTAAGSLGTFDSNETISTVTLQATEPDGGSVTFNITSGALPTGLSLTGANIDGTTTTLTSTTLYSFTVEAIDDENQSTGRSFSITVNAALVNTDVFDTVTYTGTGSTYNVGNGVDASVTVNSGVANYALGSTSYGNNSGKKYFEVEYKTAGSSGTPTLMVGIINTAYVESWTNAQTKMYYANNGNKYTGGSGSSYGATYTEGDIIGVAYDGTARTVTFYKNNVGQGTAFTGLITNYPSYKPAIGTALNSETAQFRFTTADFTYTPPTGYSEWGSSTVSVSGGSVNSAVAAQPIDFQPDLVWIKGRSYSDSHGLVDSVRGANKILFSNNTSQQGSYSNTLTSFDSNGFTLGADATQILNKNTETYVAWCWKAGGAAVSNTDGSITSTVSANQDAGFSVVKFDGASGANTVGHGLSQAPDLFIMKSVNVGGSWGVYVKDLGANKYLTLNDSAAVATSTGVWNNTHPTSTLLHWQGGLIAAGGTGQYNNIAYCFHSVDGYQRIGTYTGAATPNRIYTTDDGTSSGTGGFKPRFLLIKADRTNNSWVILDAERDGNTENGNALFANLSIAEWGASNTTIDIDFVDDGFILQNNYESVNYTTATTEYIYLAIA